jgi:hypothetical protein
MNVVFSRESIPLDEKYTALELDTIMVDGQDPVTAFCLVENIPITEITATNNWISLHADLIKNYKLRNWEFCENALEHLIGKWNREADSFYIDLSQRIVELKEQDLGPDWDGIIRR